MKGFGGMISVYLKGGLEEASVFMQSLKVISLINLNFFLIVIHLFNLAIFTC